MTEAHVLAIGLSVLEDHMARRRVERSRRPSRGRTDVEEMLCDADTASEPEIDFEAITEQLNHLAGVAKAHGISFLAIVHSQDPLSEGEELAWFNNASSPTAMGLSQMLNEYVSSGLSYSPVGGYSDEDDRQEA